MPLNEIARSKYDEQAARDFYFKMEGTPYGYQNFLYGWIDTVRDNLPMLLPNEMIPIVFSVLEKLDRKASDLIFSDGLNIRLGTQGLTIPELVAKAADLNMTLQDAMTIPEKDGWNYAPGPVYVCSSFATAIWKAAGIFDVDFQATEVTPHDIYMLNVLETDPAKRPQICKDADPTLQYCQLMGKYEVLIPESEFGTLAPYENMFERCTTITPDYAHLPQGC